MMSGSSDEEQQQPRKKKRGLTHPECYKRNIIREARVKGKGYETYKGKQVQGKVLTQNITCKCPLKCYLKIDDECKKQIWEYFYTLESKNAQDLYLQTLVEAKEVSRRSICRQNIEQTINGSGDIQTNQETPKSFKRNHTYVYYIKINNELTPVCKNVFLNIHKISADRMKRICQLLLKGESPRDLRGKSRSGNALSGNICVLIHQHISSYDIKQTHYGGKPKQYLDARLTVKKMHEMFIDKNPELENVVKYSFFLNYFKENFDLTFGRPQVDVCCQCESLSSKLKDPLLSDNAKRNVAAELIIHKRRAKKFYHSLKLATEDKNDDTVAICFDFMQNLPLPHLPVQEVFYLRQLWVNNFCIHDLKRNKAKMYVYHEGTGNKSPNEVCSFIFNYIKNDIPDTIKHLILFSDGPYGQNKNNTVIRFLMNLCDNCNFESITYNFPVRGHSYSPCDRDFGCIKRLIRKVDRIYTPEEYKELILRASNTGRFSVHTVKSEEILNFKDWWPASYKKTTAASDETSGRNVAKKDKEPFKISTYKQFIFSSTTKGKVVVRQFIDGISSSTFTFLKCDTPPELPTQLAYPQGKVSVNALLSAFSIQIRNKLDKKNTEPTFIVRQMIIREVVKLHILFNTKYFKIVGV